MEQVILLNKYNKSSIGVRWKTYARHIDMKGNHRIVEGEAMGCGYNVKEAAIRQALNKLGFATSSMDDISDFARHNGYVMSFSDDRSGRNEAMVLVKQPSEAYND